MEIFQYLKGVIRKTDTCYQHLFCQEKGQQFLTKRKGRFRLEIRKVFFLVNIVVERGHPQKLWVSHYRKHSKLGWTGL